MTRKERLWELSDRAGDLYVETEDEDIETIAQIVEDLVNELNKRPEQCEDEENADSPSDVVNHPSHYTQHPSAVECIQITEHMNFCIGNAIKYLWRAGLKGAALEDLKKARWYVDREIARLEQGSNASADTA